MELLVCSQKGGHHFSLCLPAYSPLPSPCGDLDHLGKHCHSSCNSHSPWDKQVKQEELDSSSHSHDPWTTYPDLQLNSTLSLSHFLLNSTLWCSIALPVLSMTSLMRQTAFAHHDAPDDGTPLVVLGDFSIHPEKLHSSELIDFFSTFDLTLSSSPPTGPGTNSTLSSKSPVVL